MLHYGFIFFEFLQAMVFITMYHLTAGVLHLENFFFCKDVNVTVMIDFCKKGKQFESTYILSHIYKYWIY